MKTRLVLVSAVVLLSILPVSEATPFTRTSPAGGTLPSAVTEVGGVVTDMIGANNSRIVSQLPASALFLGFANTGTPAAYQGNPMTIGIQAGFTPPILANLGGGLLKLAVRISLYDGDTGPGDFDQNQNTLLINGVAVGNFSDVVTEATSQDGLTSLSSNPSGGFRDATLDTGFFLVTDPAVLASIYAALLSTGELVFQLYDTDPNDNYFDFSQGVDGGLIDVGVGPTIVKAAAQKKITVVDAAAISSAVDYALPAALAHRQVILGFARAAVRDLNARLYRARSTGEAERNDGAEGRSVSVFAAGDFSIADAEPNGLAFGYESDTWAATGGAELNVTPNLNVGFAATVLSGQADLDRNVASIETAGVLLSPYATWFRGPMYVDALYSYGMLTSEIDRSTGKSRISSETDSFLHAVELNAGWNFESNGLVFGPLVGGEYRNLSVEGYREGSVWGAVAYEDQTIESAISRLGGQITAPMRVKGARIVPQLRAAWEHEYMDDEKDVTVRLQRSPVTIIEGRTVREGEPFSTTLRSATLEDDYLSLGAGVRVELGRGVSVMLDYEGHFFRGDSTLHMAAAKVLVDL